MILALIALIATPIIVGVINDAKKNAFTDTAYGIIEAGKLYYAGELDNDAFLGKDFDFSKNIEELKLSGEKPGKGWLTVNKSGEQSLLVTEKTNTWCAQKGFVEDKVKIEPYQNSHCASADIIPGSSFSGLVKDFSKKGQDGLAHNISYEKGAAVLNGNAYISSGYAKYPFTKGITLVTRFYYGSNIGSTSNNIIANWEDSGGGITAYGQSIIAKLYINGAHQTFEITGITKDVYHTVVLTYDGITYTFYIDGIVKDTKPITGQIKVSPYQFAIGANPNWDGWISLAHTKITDALVMDRGVTNAEVTTYFTDNIPLLDDDAVLFQYKF